MGHVKAAARPDSLLVSREEARALLGIGNATFDALLRKGDIPVIRYGVRGVRIRRADLDAYAAKAVRPWAE